jgi:hypothetical protein
VLACSLTPDAVAWFDKELTEHSQSCPGSLGQNEYECQLMVAPLTAGSCPRSLQVGDAAAARVTWLRLVEAHPTNGHACAALGAAEQREGLLQAAEIWYRRGCDCRGGAGPAVVNSCWLAQCMLKQMPGQGRLQRSALDMSLPFRRQGRAAVL